MRLIFPLASLLVALFSLRIDHYPIPYDDRLCERGLCRLDQMSVSIDEQGLNSKNFLSLLAQDPGSPILWATYGELLAMEGKIAEAAAMYDRAVELGPHMAPVLMRTANFDFTHGRSDHGRLMARQIIERTGVFDQILFSYITSLGLPLSEVLDVTIPAAERPARSWLSWLQTNGSEGDLLATWDWMRQHRLIDERTALDLTRALWGRRFPVAAQQVWSDWLGERAGTYLNPERIWNSRFTLEPTSSPFDWAITAPRSVQIARKNGLEIQFLGNENVNFSTVRQNVTVRPGTYRFTAEIEADGLSTDQHPFFSLNDAFRSNALNIRTAPIEDTRGPSKLQLDFAVPPGTQALRIQLERRPSERFDNKIKGVLRVHAISLVPVSQ